jgi:cytochrome c peroxidase
MKLIAVFTLSCFFILSCTTISPNIDATRVALGEMIFFDTTLSQNRNQSCASCHDPSTGWTGPKPRFNASGGIHEGAVTNRFGNRKPPTASYASFSPVLHIVPEEDNQVVGGNFWDGRATGEKLGSAVADQAQGPFLNPLEHALVNSACVVNRVCTGAYSQLFKQHWSGSCDISWPDTIEAVCLSDANTLTLNEDIQAKINKVYDEIALSIAAFESSSKLNSFTSKYDYYLSGKVKLTAQELEGLELFNNKGKCADCHPSTSSDPDVPPLFTDFTYDNLGIPANPENPFYTQYGFNPEGKKWIDYGLGDFLATRSEWSHLAASNRGKHKVPTLRNVDKRPDAQFIKAFGHNGYFKSLKEFVHFYNTRDTLKLCAPGSPGEKVNCWPAPEVTSNMNTSELGDLKLTDAEEDAIVAFMKTLSDNFEMNDNK